MWIHNLMKQLINQYLLTCEDETVLSQAFHQTLKGRLTRILGTITHSTPEYVTFDHPDAQEKVELKVTMEMCNKAFQVGFKHVKAMIESQLRQLASISNGWGAVDHIVTVIVSGGSSLHPDFIKWIKALCMDLSLPQPLFAKGMEMYYA